MGGEDAGGMLRACALRWTAVLTQRCRCPCAAPARDPGPCPYPATGATPAARVRRPRVQPQRGPVGSQAPGGVQRTPPIDPQQRAAIESIRGIDLLLRP